MLYWSRTGNPAELILWLILSSLWFAGGALISANLFSLRPRERLFVGMATGWLLSIVFSNLLAQFLPLSLAYWTAALLVFLLGLASAWQAGYRPRRPAMKFSTRGPLRQWLALIGPQSLAFLALLLLFTQINRGLSIFDDFANLPIVSMIAAGDYPPHFYLDPTRLLDYHYGLHLFAASLVRVGGFFPWSAFDISKALSLALTIMLAWLWFRRFVKSTSALLSGAALVIFGSGARWLLLFLPAGLLDAISSNIELIGSAQQTGPDLLTVLQATWKIVGDGPVPFPFAFVNGIFTPLTFQLSGMGALPMLTLFLLLLLAQRKWRVFPALIFGLALSSLALTGEHMFVIIYSGIGLALLFQAVQRRSVKEALPWLWVLIPSALIAFLGGGVLTELARQILSRLSGLETEANVGLSGLQLRWPPAVVSAHLGALYPTNFNQLIVAVCELGPILLLGPWAAWLGWKRARQNRITSAGIGLGSLLGFAAPLLIQLTSKDRDITRLMGSALFIWMALSFPILWLVLQKSKPVIRFLICAGVVIALGSGVITFSSELIAMTRPELSFFVQEPDAILSRAYWNSLEPDAQFLDIHYTYRPAVLFGRTTGTANWNVYVELPEFRALLENPDPVRVSQAGYAYIYLDRDTWQKMSPELKRLYQNECVRLVKEQKDALGDFRRLLDIRACQ